jgi:hypothetical protein
MDLNAGIALAKEYQRQGNKQAARDVLRKILSINKRHEEAWFLFSQVAENNNNEVFCLRNVLKINPVNEQASFRLAELSQPSPPRQGRSRSVISEACSSKLLWSGFIIFMLAALGIIFYFYTRINAITTPSGAISTPLIHPVSTSLPEVSATSTITVILTVKPSPTNIPSLTHKPFPTITRMPTNTPFFPDIPPGSINDQNYPEIYDPPFLLQRPEQFRNKGFSVTLYVVKMVDVSVGEQQWAVYPGRH